MRIECMMVEGNEVNEEATQRKKNYPAIYTTKVSVVGNLEW